MYYYLLNKYEKQMNLLIKYIDILLHTNMYINIYTHTYTYKIYTYIYIYIYIYI